MLKHSDHKIVCCISLILLLFSTACKPTEKGYKAAYDAALGKRQSANEALDVDLKGGELMQVDGPQIKEINGRKVFILSDRIKRTGENESLPSNYNVAVGSYKMLTNCEAQVKDYLNSGYEAFSAVDNEGKYYSIVFSTDNLEEAVKTYEKVLYNSSGTFIGLPDAPVIIYSVK